MWRYFYLFYRRDVDLGDVGAGCEVLKQKLRVVGWRQRLQRKHRLKVVLRLSLTYLENFPLQQPCYHQPDYVCYLVEIITQLELASNLMIENV